MKLKVKNYHIERVIELCNSIYPQRMLIGDKLKIKENGEKLAKKWSTIEELRKELILSNGGTIEEGIKPDHGNFQKALQEINELFDLETEISINPIPLSVLERFEVESVDVDAVLILAGTYVLPELDKKEVAFVPEVESEDK